jgi:hypothetical protein
MEAQLIRRLLLLPGLLLALTAVGQTSFYKVYSGNGYDQGQGIAQLPDSGYLVTGMSSSFEEAPSQAFLMRIDKLGNHMWSKAYGGVEFEEGKRVMPVPGYGYYVVGTSSSSGSANFDVHLFFTDETGAFQWQQFTDMGAWERTNDAVMLADTSIFVIGETDSTSNGTTDILLARYDKTGAVIWKKHIGDSGNDNAYEVICSTDTTVLICGTWYVEDSAVNKAYLAEIHKDGSILWEKTYGTIGEYRLNTLWKGGGFIKLMGQRYKDAASGWDAYAIITNDEGTLIGEDATYSVGNEARYTHMVKYTAGNTDKFFGVHQAIDTWTFEGGEDCFVSRYGSGLYWDNYGVGYNGEGQDQFNELIPTLDGYAIGVGYHTQYGGGGNSVFVVKIGNDNYFPAPSSNPTPINIVNVDELIALKGLSVYPNPVSDLLTVAVPETAFAYALFDASGKQLASGTSWGSQQLDFSAERQGVYFLRIAHESGESTTVKIVR